MRLQSSCPHCYKNLRITETIKFTNGEQLRFTKCGHILYHNPERLFGAEDIDINALDGSSAAWEYQVEGMQFINECNGTGLIADEMGLGKTVQALLLKRAAKEKWKCTLIVVKSATTWQWFKMYKKWASLSLTGVFMLRETKGFIPPGFGAYVVSMDTFSRMVRAERNPYGKIIKVSINPQLAALGIDSIIVDECQSFKDPAANRTTALVAFIQQMNIKYKVFLSGTPIKNRADEYFTTLNILDPENFNSIEQYRRDWLMQDNKGRWSFVNPYRLEQFRELISNYVIRREKKDVLKSLPEFRRAFETISIEDDKMKEAYNREVERLREISDSKENITYMDVSDSLMTLRRIIGMAKVDFCVDYVDTFLDTVENEKIAIGIHHHAVRDLLYAKLQARSINVLKLSGEDNSDRKEQIKKEFEKPENRVLVISVLAGGVGMDGLQICNNVITLERQWNSVDEEQFEARFHRAGQKNPVLCEYFIAQKTIDDFFHQLVEQKREIFGQAVGNDWSLMSDNRMLRDLVDRTVASKL